MSLIFKIIGLICWFVAAFSALIGVNVTRINLVAAGAFFFFLPDVIPL